jgi:PAS domain-containing protein
MNNALAEGIYMQNRDGAITRVNPAACQLLGYDADELLGQVAHDLFHRHGGNGAVPRKRAPFSTVHHSGKDTMAKSISSARTESCCSWRRQPSHFQQVPWSLGDRLP